jgi:hypothetical protein
VSSINFLYSLCYLDCNIQLITYILSSLSIPIYINITSCIILNIIRLLHLLFLSVVKVYFSVTFFFFFFLVFYFFWNFFFFCGRGVFFFFFSLFNNISQSRHSDLPSLEMDADEFRKIEFPINSTTSLAMKDSLDQSTPLLFHNLLIYN